MEMAIMCLSMADALLAPLDRFLEADARRTKQRRLGGIEAQLERNMARAFREQGRRFVREFGSLRHLFQESVTPADWMPLLDRVFGETEDLFVDTIQQGAAAALTTGWDAGAANLGVTATFNLSNPRAVAYLDNYGARRVTMINDTTRSYILTVVDNGVREGWSYDRMARAISGRYREFAVGMPQQHIQSRAHLVAVTEAGEAYEAGNMMLVDDLAAGGLRMQKAWLTVGDDRVSQGCQDNQAQGWIPLDAEFQSGHTRPLRFPGCRCTAEYRRARSD